MTKYTLIFTTSYCLRCHLKTSVCSHMTPVVVTRHSNA